MTIARRSFLKGLGAALFVAPAIITTPGLLMPVRAVVLPPAPEPLVPVAERVEFIVDNVSINMGTGFDHARVKLTGIVVPDDGITSYVPSCIKREHIIRQEERIYYDEPMYRTIAGQACKLHLGKRYHELELEVRHMPDLWPGDFVRVEGVNA